MDDINPPPVVQTRIGCSLERDSHVYSRIVFRYPGGYALVYDSKTQQIRSLDFIGAAPADTKPEMFTAGARLWDRAHPARDSFAAPVVPGNLAGWAALHDQYGTMSWAQLLAPAIEYAEKGFVVTPAVRDGFDDADFGGAVGRYPYGAGIFFKEGKPWPVADVLKQPNLAGTFRSIAAGGPAVFYGGSLAKRFALGSAGGWTIPQTIVQVAVRGRGSPRKGTASLIRRGGSACSTAS